MVERRSPKPEVRGSIPLAPAKLSKKVFIMKLANFFGETKKEVSKISWIEKKDLLQGTLSVFFIVGIFSIFFLLVDLVISRTITYILGVF